MAAPTVPAPPLRGRRRPLVAGDSLSLQTRHILAAVAAVIGVALIVAAIIYWVEPAHSLPRFFPGHDSGSDTHHVKHGIAALVVGLALLAFAWFQSGKGSHEQAPAA